ESQPAASACCVGGFRCSTHPAVRRSIFWNDIPPLPFCSLSASRLNAVRRKQHEPGRGIPASRRRLPADGEIHPRSREPGDLAADGGALAPLRRSVPESEFQQASSSEPQFPGPPDHSASRVIVVSVGPQSGNHDKWLPEVDCCARETLGNPL